MEFSSYIKEENVDCEETITYKIKRKLIIPEYISGEIRENRMNSYVILIF